MRHGCLTSFQNEINNPCSGGTQHRQRRRNSNRRCPPARSRAWCSWIDKVLCFLNSCPGKKSIVRHYEISVAQYRIKGVECFRVESSRFVTMAGNTQSTKLKISTHHLVGNNLITLPTVFDLVPSHFHLFLDLEKFPAGKYFNDIDDVMQEVQT